MKKLLGACSAIAIITACLFITVSCIDEKEEHPIEIKSIEELSIVLGKQYLYPEDSERIAEIKITAYPCQLPKKLEYIEFLDGAEFLYNYEDADECKLNMLKTTDRYITDYTERYINGIIVREAPISPLLNGKYIVQSEFIKNEMRYLYSVTFENKQGASNLQEKAEAAQLWIREQIRGFKLYE